MPDPGQPSILSDQQREQLRAVVVLAGSAGSLANSPVHGDRHWRSVAMIGSRLCAETPGVDLYPVLLFAMLHDCRRMNESWDDEHGHRAALLLDELAESAVISLDTDVHLRLSDALERHDQGDVSDDPLIGVCWDADRLCLPRVGIRIDPAYLSTPAGVAGRAWNQAMIERPVSWGALISA